MWRLQLYIFGGWKAWIESGLGMIRLDHEFDRLIGYSGIIELKIVHLKNLANLLRNSECG